LGGNPWAAGTKTAPFPTATHLKPLRGSDEKAGYIDLGPVRAGLIKCSEEWPWSSVHDYAGGLSAGVGAHGIPASDHVLLPTDQTARI